MEKRTITLKRIIIILLFFILGVLLVLTINIYKTKHDLIHEKEMPITLTVDYFWGYIPFEFNNTNIVDFSRLVPGQIYTKQIEVQNPFDYTVEAVLRSKGTTRQFLYINENYVKIPPNKVKNLSITAIIPPFSYKDIEEKTGDYNGTLYISLYKT